MNTKTLFRLLTVAAGLVITHGAAQGDTGSAVDTTKANTHAPVLQKLSLSAAYYGDTASHPGLDLGASYLLVERGMWQMAAGADLGFYHHERNHDAAWGVVELENRLTTSFGLMGELLIGGGYQHRWADGTIYKRKADGSVGKANNSGHAHFMPTTGIGVGWDAEKNGGPPLKFFLRVRVNAIYPFNRTWLPAAAIQTGLRWSPWS